MKINENHSIYENRESKVNENLFGWFQLLWDAGALKAKKFYKTKQNQVEIRSNQRGILNNTTESKSTANLPKKL